MATFTTYAALRTAILDAIQTAAENNFPMKSFSFGNRAYTGRTVQELVEAYRATYELEALDSAGDRDTMVTYGELK